MTILEQLKFQTGEDGDARAFTDAQLNKFLELCSNDVSAASYAVLLRKAQVDEVTLPDGTKLPSNRPYWLSLASQYRASMTGHLLRADEKEVTST